MTPSWQTGPVSWCCVSGVHEHATLLPAASSSEPAIACSHGKSENDQQAGWLPSAPSHPAVCSWRLASSPYILQASGWCGQQGASESSGGEWGQRGDSPAPPLRARKRLRAQSGGKRPHPCCPGSSSPFLTPRRSSVRSLAHAFCSCRGLAGGDPSLIPTELSLEPVVVVTLFCKGHYCLQFSLLCLN